MRPKDLTKLFKMHEKHQRMYYYQVCEDIIPNLGEK